MIDSWRIRLTNYIVAQFGSSWMLVGLFLSISSIGSSCGLTSLSIGRFSTSRCHVGFRLVFRGILSSCGISTFSHALLRAHLFSPLCDPLTLRLETLTLSLQLFLCCLTFEMFTWLGRLYVTPCLMITLLWIKRYTILLLRKYLHFHFVIINSS